MTHCSKKSSSSYKESRSEGMSNSLKHLLCALA